MSARPRPAPWRILLGPACPADPTAVDALVGLWATLAGEGDVRAVRALLYRPIPARLWTRLERAIRDGWGLAAGEPVALAVRDRVIAIATGPGRTADVLGALRVIAAVASRGLEGP